MKEVLVLLVSASPSASPRRSGLGRYVSTQSTASSRTTRGLPCTTVALLALVSAAAGMIPAHRASRIDPILALSTSDSPAVEVACRPMGSGSRAFRDPAGCVVESASLSDERVVDQFQRRSCARRRRRAGSRCREHLDEESRPSRLAMSGLWTVQTSGRRCASIWAAGLATRGRAATCDLNEPVRISITTSPSLTPSIIFGSTREQYQEGDRTEAIFGVCGFSVASTRLGRNRFARLRRDWRRRIRSQS